MQSLYLVDLGYIVSCIASAEGKTLHSIIQSFIFVFLWMKQPISSTHLKVLLGCLLDDGMKRGGEDYLVQKSYSEEILGKLQENLTEVLWW